MAAVIPADQTGMSHAVVLVIMRRNSQSYK